MSKRLGSALFGLLIATASCAELRPIVAPSADLEDYRAFRVAAAEGTRLARAKRYLDRHPNGTWAAEVKRAFDEEEPRHFARAQGSREGVRSYLADLPEGPHAAAAFALLIAYGSSVQDAELRDLARRVRFEDAKLEAAAVQRRAVGEAILSSVGVLLDDDVYGAPRTDAPPKLRSLLVGKNAPTWGGVPAKHEDDYFFLLPTRPERESRLLTLEISVIESEGIVVGVTLEGSDLLLRWTEAERIVRLDPSAPEDRAEAHAFTMARLEGALERRFPSASCPDKKAGRELYHRTCDGWEAIVLAGKGPGDKDAVILRAPRDRKAEAPGEGRARTAGSGH